MLHEILLALAGHAGEVVVCCFEPSGAPPSTFSDGSFFFSNRSGFQINTELQFLTSTERDILNRIVSIGYDYALIKHFVKCVQEANSNTRVNESNSSSGMWVKEEPGETVATSAIQTHDPAKRSNQLSFPPFGCSLTGYYISALTTCMESILYKYLEKICFIEKEVVADPFLPISFVFASLGSEKMQLQTLRSFIEQYCTLAAPMHKSYHESLGLHVHAVSCGMILNYLSEGLKSGNPSIKGIYQQLFEAGCRVFVYQLAGWICGGQLLDPYSEFFIHRPLLADKEAATGSANRRTQQVTEDCTEFLSPHALKLEWNYAFRLIVESIPTCCLSISAAGKTLLIGKMLRLLKRTNSVANANLTSEDEILSKLDSVVNDGISPTKLGEIIEDISVELSRVFWKLIKTESNFFTELKMLKSIYLLGNGFFYQCLMDVTREMTKTSQEANANINVGILGWRKAITVWEDSVSHALESNEGTAATEDGLMEMEGSEKKTVVKIQGKTSAKENITMQGEARRLIAEEFLIARKVIPRIRDDKFVFDEFQKNGGFRRTLSFGGNIKLKGSSLLLNASKNSSERKMRHSSNTDAFSCCWYNEKQRISHGFQHGFDVQLDPSHRPIQATHNISYMAGRVAIVFQNVVSPQTIKRSGHLYDRSFWPLLGDCLAIEITIAIETPESDGNELILSVKAAVYIGGQWIAKLFGYSLTEVSEVTATKRLHLNATLEEESDSSADESGAEEAHGNKSQCPFTRMAAPVILLKEGTMEWTGLSAHVMKGLRIRVQHQYHKFEVYADPLCKDIIRDEQRLPIVEIESTDVTRMLDLDAGAAFVGLVTMPVQYQHDLLSTATALDKCVYRSGAAESRHRTGKCAFSSDDIGISISRWFHTAMPTPFSLPEVNALSNKEIVNGWRNLSLSYTPQWPTFLVISPANIDCYNAVFKLLLHTKRTHKNLQHLWVFTAFNGRYIEDASPGGAELIFLLRSRMEFTISHLLLYFQEIIIEDKYAELCENLMNTEDFEKMALLHEDFLAQIITKCFLRQPDVMRYIMELIDVANNFCSAFKKFHNTADPMTQERTLLQRTKTDFTSTRSSQKQTRLTIGIPPLSQKFKKVGGKLYEALVALSDSTPHIKIGQLLLMLNYNECFGKMASENPPTTYSDATSIEDDEQSR